MENHDPNHSKTVELESKLLRGEISAVETYRQALEKFDGEPETAILSDIIADHEEAVAILSEHLAGHGGDLETSSGVWGGFAKAVEGTARIFGESASLLALLEGEKIGISDYESALGNPDADERIKTIIRDQLLPGSRDHVAALEALRA